MSICHSPKKRCSSKKKKSSEYHHQIDLVDDTLSISSSKSRSKKSKRKEVDQSIQAPRKQCSVKLYPHQSPFHLREGLIRKKFAKYQEIVLSKNKDNSSLSSPEINFRERSLENQKEDRSGSQIEFKKLSALNQISKEPEYAVDVLFENQRGVFCCGIPLFSARALGSLDPAPWTNIAQKPSATDITNAQTPDPSWEWTGENWSIHNASDHAECWRYSFAFHGNYSWHRGRWWNSFVRRRAWVRRRVKKKHEYFEDEEYVFGSHDTTAHPTKYDRHNRLPSSKGKNHHSDGVLLGKRDTDREIIEKICDITSLKKAFRLARIDRELIDALRAFIKNGSQELFYLKDHMHYIMYLFIFQASRRSLVVLLRESLNKALEERENCNNFQNEEERDKFEALKMALHAAEEEIKVFEF